MSLVQIVDKDDNLIGHKPRTEVDYQHDIYRSSCIWIENSKGEVLLAQRKWTKDKDPGMWGTAASGTIDDDESYEENAYKEAEEEIGLTGVKLTKVTKILEHTPRRQFIEVYKGIVDWPIEKFKIQEDEVEQIAWVSKQELVKDCRLNPKKYVPTMPGWIKLFIDDAGQN